MKRPGDSIKNLLQGLWIAVSMYSKLPVPMVEWKKESLSLALCFFPAVGIIIGAAEILWWYLAGYLGFGQLLTGAVGAVLPLVITGGIHMDGFMDTQDARSSYGDREKKLGILKDAHLGAFSVIRFGIYMTVSVALYSELKEGRQVWLLAWGYLMSRAWSAVSFVTCRPAKRDGLFYEFASAANKRAVLCSSVAVLAAGTWMAAEIYLPAGLLFPVVSGMVFWYYRRVSNREFGGITGDLAGYFLQLCELWILGTVVVAGRGIG